MSHYIETEINETPCAFYVNVICDDQSFDYSYGSQNATEHRIGFEFEVEDWEGCTKEQALQWCETNASKLIEREMREIESDKLERQLADLD